MLSKEGKQRANLLSPCRPHSKKICVNNMSLFEWTRSPGKSNHSTQHWKAASFAKHLLQGHIQFSYCDQSSARLNRNKKDRHWGREPLEPGGFWQREVNPKFVAQHQKDLCCITSLLYMSAHFHDYKYTCRVSKCLKFFPVYPAAHTLCNIWWYSYTITYCF